MTLIDVVVDGIWEGFENEDNACVDRAMDLIDTGGHFETFSMPRVAQRVLDSLRNAGYKLLLVEDVEDEHPDLALPAEIPTANLVDDDG